VAKKVRDRETVFEILLGTRRNLIISVCIGYKLASKESRKANYFMFLTE